MRVADSGKPGRIVLLGTGTCQIEEHRTASSILLELAGERLVFDFGRGTCRRLAEHGLRQDDVEHVVLSHFHADHVSALIPFLQAATWSRIDPRGRDLQVYGPPGLHERLGRLLAVFPPGDLIPEDRFAVRLHEIAGDRLRVGATEFDFVGLPPAGNRGLRFRHEGRLYAFTGDSHYHDQEVAFLQGVHLAVIDSGHLTDEEIVELAARTGVERLVCSHLYRELEPRGLNTRAAKAGYAGRIEVARDGMTYTL